ncbi:unnamed protein product [Urochloa decumbens]|uniref:non-specific serine/threonine protein kinase n=1 Tax=Urochloa decumbens TaxID=240449 RepID=A0ABC9E0U8_9POAL
MDGEASRYDTLESTILDESSAPCIIPLEYLRKITNNFSDDRLLGKGGFGKVYKGVLLQTGKVIAVKKLDHHLKLAVQERQFENEVYHLMRLKHPNIVRFVGYCYETQNECVAHNGKYIFVEMQQRLHCLEYLSNGSLDKHLKDESSGFDWRTRYKIIKGICYGLYYLHDECKRRFNASIIHLDLKPANILLDENMWPKVADFGLSRLFEDSKSQTHTNFISGSLGYMAPEYLIGRIITSKADIYNLGVIIMEIITGSKVDIFSLSSPTSCQDFVERVLYNWRNRLEGAPSETDCKQIKSCVEIGLCCIKLKREQRPTSKEIVERLGRLESTSGYINDKDKPPAEQPNTRGLFRRQLSRVMRFMTPQRSSCTSSSFKVPDAKFKFAQLDADTEDIACGELSGPSSLKVAAEKFTFTQLEAAAFGFEAKIGEGSFGTVYRGKLPDGREVAIKRGESGPRTAGQFRESAFGSELASLSHCHHRHIVSLVGYCEENKERLLVYEYMKNGSLYDHLHPKAATLSTPSPVVSSWKLRIKILLDASRGIEYLHSYAVPSVIHRDIKSSNILLDVGWTARVSGFGLSLMVSEAQDQDQTVKAAGTVGYMDPEYYGLRHVSVKSDVYGFGVVMLEVLTGKRAIFKEAEGGSVVSVVDYAVPSIVAGELGKILDPRAPEPEDEAEAVEVVAYTAVHCVRLELEGRDRPAMYDVVANLETALALCEGISGGGSFGSSSASVSVSSMDRENELV